MLASTSSSLRHHGLPDHRVYEDVAPGRAPRRSRSPSFRHVRADHVGAICCACAKRGGKAGRAAVPASDMSRHGWRRLPALCRRRWPGAQWVSGSGSTIGSHRRRRVRPHGQGVEVDHRGSRSGERLVRRQSGHQPAGRPDRPGPALVSQRPSLTSKAVAASIIVGLSPAQSAGDAPAAQAPGRTGRVAPGPDPGRSRRRGFENSARAAVRGRRGAVRGRHDRARRPGGWSAATNGRPRSRRRSSGSAKWRTCRSSATQGAGDDG